MGNVMIDTLVRLLPVADPSRSLERLALTNGAGPVPYVLVTLHRPSNVDEPATLSRLLDALAEIGGDVPVLLPMHPRTKARIAEMGTPARNVTVTEPLFATIAATAASSTIIVTSARLGCFLRVRSVAQIDASVNPTFTPTNAGLLFTNGRISGFASRARPVDTRWRNRCPSLPSRLTDTAWSARHDDSDRRDDRPRDHEHDFA